MLSEFYCLRNPNATFAVQHLRDVSLAAKYRRQCFLQRAVLFQRELQ